jgi:hypothetical protein
VYPYINGGFHGEVTEVAGQVDPQPSASHVRKEGSAYSQSPLRGALIKDFTPSPDGKTFELRYTLNGKALSIKYVANEDGTWTFTYSRPDGTPVVETYKPNECGPGGGGAKGEGKGGKGGKGGKRPPNESEGAKGETGDLGEQAQPGNPEANRPKSDRHVNEF